MGYKCESSTPERTTGVNQDSLGSHMLGFYSWFCNASRLGDREWEIKHM